MLFVSYNLAFSILNRWSFSLMGTGKSFTLIVGIFKNLKRRLFHQKILFEWLIKENWISFFLALNISIIFRPFHLYVQPPIQVKITFKYNHFCYVWKLIFWKHFLSMATYKIINFLSLPEIIDFCTKVKFHQT